MRIFEHNCHSPTGIETVETLNTVFPMNNLGGICLICSSYNDWKLLSWLGLWANPDTFEADHTSLLIADDFEFSGHHSHLLIRLPSRW